MTLSADGPVRRVPERSPHGIGLPPASVAELEAWLDQGPLLLDGARWFSEGHWCVGTGYDARSILIRDSSGWDTRYPSWPRRYGEVGFSGWVAGVAAGGPRHAPW